LSRNHLYCNLCADTNDKLKNIYYKDYKSLEIHFSKTHFLCPYEMCKLKCFVAFKTEDELRAHLDIEHSNDNKKSGKVNANALLGFQVAGTTEEVDPDAEDDRKGGKGKRNYGI